MTDKYTGVYLVQYACQYGSEGFLQEVKRLHGAQFLVEQFTLQTQSGKTALFFAAQACQKAVIKLVLKVLKKSG